VLVRAGDREKGDDVSEHRGRAVLAVAVASLAAATLALVGTAVASAAVARMVVTPSRRRRQDVRILDVAADVSTITLAATPETEVPGRVGMYFSADTGYLRLGEIVREDAYTVTRAIEAVDYGDPRRATHGRLNGWWYLRPEELGLPVETVDIPTDGGDAPAWLFPAARAGKRWAIHVHGRGARRQECLRAIPTFHRAGYTSLVVSYRNDGDAPPSPDGRYGLGSTEWHDVEAAIEYATAHGATSIVLMGWSMGGAIVLQTLARTAYAASIIGVVLESPVVDWVPTLQFQAKQLRLPGIVTRSAMRVIDAPWAPRVTGQSAPVGLPDLDFVARADELAVPILLLHSDDDGYVPATASHELARLRPDIVTYVPFSVAHLTRLWNYDEKRWTTTIADWLRSVRTTARAR